MGNNALPEFERANVGDFVKFGRYPQESGNEPQPVEWQVLSKENGQMLVISRYGLDSRRFDGSSNNWGNSKIRKWLNGEFYNGSFFYEEKARIKSFNQDNVFLLSKEEAEKYFADDDARKCKPTSYAKVKGAWTGFIKLIWDNGCGDWWLRSPGPNNKSICYVCNFGYVCDGSYVSNDNGSVRPALWIDLESYRSEIRKSYGSNPFKNANVGDYVEFGCYPQTEAGEVWPVEWQVLSKENGRMLVISRYGLDAKRFDGSSNDWGNSEIRQWLNGEFYNGAFAAEEKARIKSFNQDNVFLLSKEEAEKYFANNFARRCNPTSYAKAKGALEYEGYCFWWLRSSYPYNSDIVFSVNYCGDVNFYYDVSRNGGSVRPALWINLESYGLSDEASTDADVLDLSEICKSSGSSAEARAYADVPDRSEIRRSSGSNPFKNANVGDYVKFGRYPQTEEGEVLPVEWQVLSKENGRMLVISRYGLYAKRFDGSSNNWGDSEIRQWLNGEFYNSAFSVEEKARIKSFNQDNVFLLSKEEAEKYFADDDERECEPTSYAKSKGALTWGHVCCCWWLILRSPIYSSDVWYVRGDGDIRSGLIVYNDDGSVRPALWIDLES